MSVNPPHRNNVAKPMNAAVGTVKTCSGIRAPKRDPKNAPIETVAMVIRRKPIKSAGIGSPTQKKIIILPIVKLIAIVKIKVVKIFPTYVNA